MKLDKVLAVRTNKTVYRDGHLAIKVFDSDYSKADVLNEALNQARVEETALNIPRLHEVCTVGGKWAIVSDFIPGKTLARLMEENPDRRDEYMDLFVDLQLKMHAQTCPLLGKLKDKMNRKIDETGAGAPPPATSCTRDCRACPTTRSSATATSIPRTSSCATTARPSSWTGPTPRRATPAPTRPARTCCSGSQGDIDGAESYLHLFCKKSDTARQYVQKWIPIVAASQSVKGRAEEREFLLHWVNVVDYE